MQAGTGRRGSRPEPLSESEIHHFSSYAKIPHGKSVGSEGPATFSSGDHAHLATENDGMQPRESESHIPQDRASRSGNSASYTGNFDNGTPGNSFRKFSTAGKCFLQPTQSNEQDTASQVQPVKCVPEEDDSILFSFD
ncbi:hypothetical protein PENSTE_c053G07510 [Penicillium steckii]|uniref:Uncharacterized protein n=1 Tax=Penicillium steckii TaxID=303698 RepID=A0A1V6SIR4_9EURO|nr:hypothetical protein PENSTE_c053G07510 [Penicillium steckii]